MEEAVAAIDREHANSQPGRRAHPRLALTLTPVFDRLAHRGVLGDARHVRRLKLIASAVGMRRHEPMVAEQLSEPLRVESQLSCEFGRADHPPHPRLPGAPWDCRFPNRFQPSVERSSGRSGHKLPQAAICSGFLKMERTGIEPVTSGLQSRRSPS
jgi:hypothetical protein